MDVDDEIGAAPGGPADNIRASLAAAGYPRIEPAILQPASVFLDQSGEDIRGRIYLTSDAAGAELCLRPEYTIPVCRAYLASPQAGAEAAFSYCGPVFRLRPGQDGEFVQAGLESFGRPDAPAADAEILAVALEAAEAAGLADAQVRIGDAGLVEAMLAALNLPPPWLRRLRRGLMRGRAIADIFAPAANGREHDHSGVLAALEGVDRKGARALVEDLLSIAGIKSVGGRSAGERAAIIARAAPLHHVEAGAGEEGVGVFLQATLGGHRQNELAGHAASPSRSTQIEAPTAGMSRAAPRVDRRRS